MRSLPWKPVALALLLFLGGCLATISNTPAPVTPREKLAALEITYQEANRTILDMTGEVLDEVRATT